MKEIIITATVLILCILLIRRIFRGKISSRLQYALWLLVALRLVIPVSAQIDMEPFTRLRLMDLVGRMESERGDVAKRLEEPVRVTMDSQGMLYRLIGSDAQKAAMEDALNSMPDDGASAVFMVGTLGFTWLDVLGAVWMLGMLAVGAWIIVSNIMFNRKLKNNRQSFALPEEEGAALLTGKDGMEIFRKKGTTRLPELYLAEHISSPCLYGLPGREAVYLTPDVAEDSDRLRHVLTHELVHKKHGDSFWALLRSVLVTVYWFHPLVWVAAVCSKRDCELACDEGALRALGEEERISYGETLLSIITKKGRLSDLVCTATTMTGSGKSVKERIRFIAEKPKALFAAVAAVLFLAAAVCFFVFTRDPQFDGAVVDAVEGLTVTGADMQIHLPASIGGISGCFVEDKNDTVVIYHIKSGEEVGRFSRMPLKDALQMVDEGREVVALGDHGHNYLLREYQGEPFWRTEHTYTPANVAAADVMAEHEESVIVVSDDAQEEEKIDYLPHESITTTVYQPREVNVDEIEAGCYVYVKADYYGKVKPQYAEEMAFIDRELKAAAENAIILSLNRERRKALFDALTENRTPYLGDDSKVGALLTALPLPPTLNRADGFSLQTAAQPYSLRFDYEQSITTITKEDRDMLYFNAAMLFYAIGNVEEIAIAIKDPADETEGRASVMTSYSREELAERFPVLREADFEDAAAFREGILGLHDGVEAYLAGE